MSATERRYLAPGRIVRGVVNPLAMRLGLATTLAVRRRSGGTQVLPVNVLEHDGGTFLVSVRGEADWVRNLRAAGECELRRRGRTRTYDASAVALDRAGPLIAEYRRRWGSQVGKFFKELPDPADHPVFELTARP